MFEKMLRDSPDEQWDLFFPVDNHWPTAEQFASYQVPTLTQTLLLHLRFSPQPICGLPRKAQDGFMCHVGYQRIH